MLIFILLLILLSLESSVALPLFSIYLFWDRLKRLSTWKALLVLLIASLAVSSFYYLSIVITSTLLYLFYFFGREKQKIWFSIALFVIFNLYIFFVGRLSINIFYLIQIPAFVFLVYKKEFKNYGGKKNQ